MKDEFSTVTQLAEVFGVSRQTIYNWIEDGRFPNSFKAGGGDAITLIPAADVAAVRKEEADKLVQQLNRLGFQAIPA